MPTLRFGNQVFLPHEGESVLDCLLRNGIRVPSSCRAGACHSCLVRAADGSVPADSQRGLKDAQKVRGYFLSCVSRPTADLAVALADVSDELLTAYVEDSRMLAASVLRLRLVPERPLDYRAGQFVNVVRGDGLVRSYSLASVPGVDTFLELHVRRVAGGQMSSWLASLQPGDTVSLRGPAGECFYIAGQPTQPLLLAGAGTGLAPLVGIARDALRHGHSGPIALFHGAREPSGLYLGDELAALSSEHPNLFYTPCVLSEPSGGQPWPVPLQVAPLGTLLASRYPRLAGFRVYLCGDPELVNALRRQVFLAGASRREIAADAFLMAPRPAAAEPPPSMAAPV